MRIMISRPCRRVSDGRAPMIVVPHGITLHLLVGGVVCSFGRLAGEFGNPTHQLSSTGRFRGSWQPRGSPKQKCIPGGFAYHPPRHTWEGQGKPPHFWAEVRGGPTYGEKWPHYLAEVGGRTPTSGKKWGATPPLLGRSRGGGGSGASPEQVQGQALNRGGGGEVQG